jgi:DedD protein
MAFFNFRRDGSTGASNAAALVPETADVVRKRAKHRLIGSAVLVLAGVLGFPLLFDTQPRPVAVDIPIEIPGKGTVKPLVIAPPPAGSTKPAADKPATDKSSSDKAPSEKIAADASLDAKEEILSSKQAAAQEKSAPAAIKNESKPVEKPEAKPEARVEPKVAAKTETKPPSKPAGGDDSGRASALLNGSSATKPAAAAAGELRLIVQVGAFADADKARDARIKLEKAGLKTYTQVADTSDGKRTRVRVGPFASKADADKAASKIKTLGLPAAILTL